MKAYAHAFASLCAVLIGVFLAFLGVIEGSLIAGIVAFITCLIIAYAFFHRAEILMVEESIGRRLFKGNLN